MRSTAINLFLLFVTVFTLVSCTQKAEPPTDQQLVVQPSQEQLPPEQKQLETKTEIKEQENKPDTRAFQKISSQNYQVDIKDFAFDPASLEINIGDSITWTQRDSVGHTVTLVSGPESFGSDLLSKGQTFSHTFTKPGVYEYKCSPHPYMRGKIIVK